MLIKSSNAAAPIQQFTDRPQFHPPRSGSARPENKAGAMTDPRKKQVFSKTKCLITIAITVAKENRT